jgi:hypothetical protein
MAGAPTAGHAATGGFSATSRTSNSTGAAADRDGAADVSSAPASPRESAPSPVSGNELRDEARTVASHAANTLSLADEGNVVADTAAPHTPVLLREVLGQPPCQGIRCRIKHVSLKAGRVPPQVLTQHRFALTIGSV